MMSEAARFQINPASKPMTLLNQTRKKSWFHRVWAGLWRCNFNLLDLNEALKSSRMVAIYYAGLKAVSIDKIMGKHGKGEEFDVEFNPIQVTLP